MISMYLKVICNMQYAISYGNHVYKLILTIEIT